MACYFVSYNKADRQWAEWIAWQIEGAGHKTIVQAWDFTPGSNFALMMDNAISTSDFIVAVLSPDYITAFYTQPEWAAAFAKDPTGEKGSLIPVRVRDCELSGLLSQIIYIDLVGLSEEVAQEKLLCQLKRERLRPQGPPCFPGGGKCDVRFSDRRNENRELELPSKQPSTSIRISNLTPITDLDRAKFIVNNFEKLTILMAQHMELIKKHNSGFEFTIDQVHKRKTFINIYLQGSLKCSIKAWLSSDYGSMETIKLSYGRNVSDSDNSYNEQITTEEKNGIIILRPIMQMGFSEKETKTIEEIVEVIISNLLVYLQ